MNVLNRQLISMYAKQLRVPTFNQYEEVIRQMNQDKGFDDFLVSLMRQELESRQESNRKRKIRSAHFPYSKTLEEFDFSYLEHVSEAQIRQLASCDFIQNKQNIVMIGNPGTGKPICLLPWASRPVCRDSMCDFTQRPIFPMN